MSTPIEDLQRRLSELEAEVKKNRLDKRGKTLAQEEHIKKRGEVLRWTGRYRYLAETVYGLLSTHLHGERAAGPIGRPNTLSEEHRNFFIDYESALSALRDSSELMWQCFTLFIIENETADAVKGLIGGGITKQGIRAYSENAIECMWAMLRDYAD